MTGSAALPSQKAETGFVIVAVLWLLAALATLAAIYSVYASNIVVASRVLDDRLQSEESIKAGLELAAYRLSASPMATRPTQGTFALRVGRSSVTLRFLSEGSRIDLNASSKELLVGLFQAVGSSPAQAEFYADRIIGWRKKPDDLGDEEVAVYQKAHMSYGPRQAPFLNVLELSLVLGIPRTVVDRVLPFVTVFNGKPEIDIATAAPEVISALPGMTPALQRSLLVERSREPRNTSALLELLGPAGSFATAEGRMASRVFVQVALDDGRRVNAEVVILIPEDGSVPYHVLYWHDDFDGPF